MVRHGVSEVTPNQKNSDLAVVSVCVFASCFHCEWVVCCGFGVLAESRVCHGVWCVSLCGCKVALVGGVYVGWVLLAVQVWNCAGGERCVDLETQKVMNFTIYPLAYLVYRFSSALTRLSCFARSALHDSDDATFRPKLKWKRPLVFSW